MSESVKGQLIGGVFYTAIAKYAGVIITFLISAILARLILPEDFGVVAISTVFITFFNILSDLGVGPAIIQNKELGKEDLSHIFSFTIYGGICIATVFFCLSWPIGAYYSKDILITICQILSVNIFFASANIVPNSLLLKDKRFKFIAARTLILQSIGGTIAVFAAFAGLGVYSLLIAPIISSIGVFVVNYIQKPQRFGWKINISSLKIIYSFSVYQFLFNFINYFSRNLDKLLIGKYIGMSPLGYYDVSYKLMMMPLQNITNVVTPVMHPILSEFQNDYYKLSEHYLKIIRLLAFIGFPLSVLLFFCAEEIILIVFGNQWVEAIPVFRILAISVGIQIVLSTSGSIFQAANTTRALFISGLLSAIVNVFGLLIALIAFKSIIAVAWALVITFSFSFFQAYWMLFCRIFKRGLFVFFRELISPLIISIIICVALFVITRIIGDMHTIISLLIKSVVYGVLLISYIYIKGEYDLKNIFLKIKEKIVLLKHPK